MPAGPFTGLMDPAANAFFSYAVATTPGEPIADVAEALRTLRAEFAPAPARFELIDDASPGAVSALLAAGAKIDGRYPVLSLVCADLAEPPVPDGVTVEVARKLNVQNMYLIINKVHSSIDSAQLKKLVEKTRAVYQMLREKVESATRDSQQREMDYVYAR